MSLLACLPLAERLVGGCTWRAARRARARRRRRSCTYRGANFDSRRLDEAGHRFDESVGAGGVALEELAALVLVEVVGAGAGAAAVVVAAFFAARASLASLARFSKKSGFSRFCLSYHDSSDPDSRVAISLDRVAEAPTDAGAWEALTAELSQDGDWEEALLAAVPATLLGDSSDTIARALRRGAAALLPKGWVHAANSSAKWCSRALADCTATADGVTVLCAAAAAAAAGERAPRALSRHPTQL
ncbi:hypothetical protein EMIHUDRAFT_246749 [Emiliania huxleyi CCMP1516]|uniref:Uncharacterized protein n=2 Tax=Emiliania huxleyi TaxID=2903 RepID=A0A0D3IQW4_EMIH1|nr:hypothetical protein EMIHUDRAFT_246749 [Emiliania huxleyi CCMP1516]EOD13649.1 hypothetical protein EMIHUDRAFT_246749 [Emiliania huxleyi CCMP1516]|eukprot:XP_005766078.1 hypothetical protein EMIHUDRAFT_246749 [Emiliania huxleyi CCMP1516]